MEPKTCTGQHVLARNQRTQREAGSFGHCLMRAAVGPSCRCIRQKMGVAHVATPTVDRPASIRARNMALKMLPRTQSKSTAGGSYGRTPILKSLRGSYPEYWLSISIPAMGAKSYEQLQNDVPDAFTTLLKVRTGSGGAHLYFGCLSPTPSRTNIRPGIDIKADDGYVVAPPSQHVVAAILSLAPQIAAYWCPRFRRLSAT